MQTQTNVRFSRTLAGRAVYSFIIGAIIAAAASWAAKGPHGAAGPPVRTGLPGTAEVEVDEPGEVTVVYEGLAKPVARELGLQAVDPAGAPIELRDGAGPAVVAVGSDAAAPAFRIAAFEAHAPGRYVISAAQAIELSAQVRIQPPGAGGLFHTMGRWILVGILGILAILLCTVRASVRAPR